MVDIERALQFLATQDRPVELAWARSTAGIGGPGEIDDALASYQNADGGFGHNLEIDIHAPDSQAFAARLAMHVMIDTGIPADHPMVERLSGWLEPAQSDDGDWRFPPGVYDHQLAPWFAGWTFPSLNPALCVAGAALRLGIGSPPLHTRIAALLETKGRPEDAESGEFYGVLPYAEYFPFAEHPQRDVYLEAVVRGIETQAESNSYDDAGHFFDHTGPPDAAIAQRLSPVLIGAQLDRLEGEQQTDGGWPTPYDPRWRAWVTANALSYLHAYGRLSAG
jgi:hypothetical protein